MIVLRLILIVIILLCKVQSVFAVQKTANHQIITKIKSNFIDIKRGEETINLDGNVIVERGDISILADNMVVYYYENQDGQGSEIKKIEAKENVKIFNSEFVATGKRGFYNQNQNNLTLEDDVVFNNGMSVARGQKFIYDLKSKKGHLVGTKNFPKTNLSDKNADSRVIVIIDDNDFKKSNTKSNKK